MSLLTCSGHAWLRARLGRSAMSWSTFAPGARHALHLARVHARWPGQLVRRCYQLTCLDPAAALQLGQARFHHQLSLDVPSEPTPYLVVLALGLKDHGAHHTYPSRHVRAALAAGLARKHQQHRGLRGADTLTPGGGAVHPINAACGLAQGAQTVAFLRFRPSTDLFGGGISQHTGPGRWCACGVETARANTGCVWGVPAAGRRVCRRICVLPSSSCNRKYNQSPRVTDDYWCNGSVLCTSITCKCIPTIPSISAYTR